MSATMPEIATVTGPVQADDLGRVLPHEHLLINLMPEYRTNGLLHDPEQMAREAMEFAIAGGTTIVDLTPAELAHGATADPAGSVGGAGSAPGAGSGPGAAAAGAGSATAEPPHTRPTSNVLALRKIAETTGVRVVLGTGHYREPYLDRHWFDVNSVRSIGELLVHDLEVGFPGTSVRAGIIGEIGAEHWYLTTAEERSFRAAAYAHHRTGATITTHAARWPVGLTQLEILQAEGVDPRGIVIGHCDTVIAEGYHEEIAKQGSFVQLDTFFLCRRQFQIVEHEVQRRVDLVLSLVRAGHIDRILLSHDVGLRENLSANGGTGYTFISTVFKERLREHGLDDEEFEHILVTNPRQALLGVRA